MAKTTGRRCRAPASFGDYCRDHGDERHKPTRAPSTIAPGRVAELYAELHEMVEAQCHLQPVDVKRMARVVYELDCEMCAGNLTVHERGQRVWPPLS